MECTHCKNYISRCAHCTVDYLSAAVGGDRARRGADVGERE